MTKAAVLVLMLAAWPATAAVDVDLQPYAEAGRAGASANLTGRVYAERRKPAGPDTPLTGATVVAIPRSDGLLQRLQQLRDEARTSATAYRGAALLIQKAREAYEKELWQAGAPDLVKATTVDSEGRFDLGPLPEGRWLVIGTWDQFHDVRAPRAAGQDRAKYIKDPHLVGFRSRMVWVREVAVSRTEPPELELTDRNVWFNGVVEDRVLDAGPRR
jgi:hypothetical protein